MSIAAAVEGGRRLHEATFVDRCALLDPVNRRDRSGGYTATLSLRLSDVPCRFGALTETDIRVIAGWTQGPATGALFISRDLVIPEGTFVQQPVADQAFWLVVGDRTPPGNFAAVRRLLIREATWGV